MAILSWNVQGIGNKTTSRYLKDLIRNYKPDLIFLMETKIGTQKMEELRKQNNFARGEYMDPTGNAGGLAIWSTDQWNINILSKHKNFIDVKSKFKEMRNGFSLASTGL